MKTKLLLFISIISLSALFSSCSEEEIKPESNTTKTAGGGVSESDGF
ncbi:hypothetical protein C900_01673 [Fulvivirga imtechensis AK7]|uniref:Uncharacterized protein n=1 Tax=Fulvivirga imtechensis AK7 TaxID=1237149 RepID=L8JTS4_9BACT|nr:hypothetical protein [Fulvivirga imtechensis]ELR72391.1 hypothetical protein C900_01673 [Fulvivirga imtechensis AK7]